MAPNAQLLFQDIGPDDRRAVIIIDFDGTLEQSYTGGARMHNNSWGAGPAGQYVGDDANVDRATRKLEDMLVVIVRRQRRAGADGDRLARQREERVHRRRARPRRQPDQGRLLEPRVRPPTAA